MMMSKKVVVAMVAVCAIAMAVLQNVEGGRDMAMKEATAQNPQMFNENLGYKSKEEYGCDGYKYKGKHKDCYEYGDCDESPYEDRSSYEKQGTESKEVAGKYGVHPEVALKSSAKPSPYSDDDEDRSAYKKQGTEWKEVAGKYGVQQKYP